MKNLFLTHLILSASVLTEKTAHVTSELRPSDILVSFLYFVAVLALIYLVLTLVSKIGKKDTNTDNVRQRDNRLDETEKTKEKEMNAESDAQSSPTEKSENTGKTSAPQKKE